MTETPANTEAVVETDPPEMDPNLFGLSSKLNSVSVAGLLFVYIAFFMFGVAAYILVAAHSKGTIADSYYPAMILCGAGAFSTLVGVGLIRAAGFANRVPTPVVSPVEWKVLGPEIMAGNENAISQYIRLTSLTGLTGLFTKLGLSGLPLATIGLTIFFTLLCLHDKEFLDLAKLTLGAFIGSFVQRQVGANQPGGTVKLPGGETLKVKTAPPPIA